MVDAPSTEANVRVDAQAALAHRIAQVWSLDPAAAAIRYPGGQLSWGEVRALALALDQRLAAAGIGRGEAVGVVLRNRPGLVVALLALLASDRCIVSLSPFQPADRLAADLLHLRLPCVVADPQDLRDAVVVSAAAEAGTLALEIDPSRASVGVVSPFGRTPRQAGPLPGIALEILTSGTTGTPKRIRIGYTTMYDSIMDGAGKAPRELLPKTAPTVMFAPLMHVSGMFGALVSIFEARPLVLLEKFSVDGWADAIAEYQVRFTSLPPTPMRMVLDARVPKEKLQSLIAVRAGTAPLPPATQRAFEQAYGIPVLVQYGATEWMGGLAGWTLDDHRRHMPAKLGSVGRPRGEVSLRIVDGDSGAELAPGQAGILEVLPKQRLGASEWTRTTDMASIDEDGFLYIHGRADDTLIRGGFKVQLNHVAEVLGQHAAVLEAAVIGLPDERLGQVPVAAFELRPGAQAPSDQEMRQFAQARLSPYQVPVRFKWVPALPRTVSMKVSRPGVRELFED